MPLRRCTILFGFIVAILSTHLAFASADAPEVQWPPITKQCKPWAYWWWMGSAVDEANLTALLETYQAAGMGGMHIIPIYGAKGYEDRYLNYLSPKWMDCLAHTIHEARRLGMDIDMTTGSGWCFGGPSVSGKDADAKVVHKVYDLAGGKKLQEKFNRGATQALVAYGDKQQVVELTDRIASDGTVDWTAPSGTWKVYHVTQKPSRRKVKRAAPGGKGYMLNPLSGPAMTRFLNYFDKKFADYTGPMPRAMYHDSYEYTTQWSPVLFDEFEKRRGYRLQQHLPALFGELKPTTPSTSGLSVSGPPDGSKDTIARVKSDYRRTVSEIITDDYIAPWADWARAKGMKSRNQAHGSPGNLLDLYAAADIPETEMFRTDRDPLVSKFASSAAHVTGKPLVAAETGTWLKEHFNATLADIKYLLDDMFISGVNHVVYHGTAYSPADAAWPGWVFYASTEMNPRNAIWRDVPAINAYIARTQSILQANQPGNDILLYWPISDQWHDPDKMVKQMCIHRTQWLHDETIGPVAQTLWDSGYTFDYLSDRRLAEVTSKGHQLHTPGGSYAVIVVPPCKLMPEASLQQLLNLASQGATVLFQDQLPSDVPGNGNLVERRKQFKKMLARITSKYNENQRKSAMSTTDRSLDMKKPRKPQNMSNDLAVVDMAPGKGRFLIGDLETALATAGVKRETMVDSDGVEFIRRVRPKSHGGGYDYFIANRGSAPVRKWCTLAVPARSVLLMDPMTGKTGTAAVRQNDAGQTDVLLHLNAGRSMIVRTFTDTDIDVPAWRYYRKAGKPVELTGTWHIDFIDEDTPATGPEIPASLTTEKLDSWTTLGDDEAKRFAGAARYRITFDAPSHKADRWMLDLGKVAQSARVTLNGRPLGTLLMAPYRIVLPEELREKGNVLEVEVTNLSMNRIRDLDIRKVKWQNFHDINFVNSDYKPFDASKWPLQESGLIGPVRLCPVERVNVDK